MPHASYAKVDKDVNVAKVQAMLAELCYKPGIVDGAWGKKTETAVKAFFAKHYRKYDGNFDVSDAPVLNRPSYLVYSKHPSNPEAINSAVIGLRTVNTRLDQGL